MRRMAILAASVLVLGAGPAGAQQAAPAPAGPPVLVSAEWGAQGRGGGEKGKRQVGAVGGIIVRRLKFDGPKWEAMNNMGPFENFLKLVGKVPSDMKKCNK